MLGSPASSRPAGARRAAGVLVLAVVLSLTACSDAADDEPSGGSGSSGSASGSPTSSPTPSASDASAADATAPRKPTMPKAADTTASRKAFARFVMDRWSYALSTNDAAAVTSLSAAGKPCVGCADLTKELATRKKQGWFVDFPGLTVDRVEVRSLSGAKGVWAATARVDIPASRSYFEDGSFRNDNEAHPNTPFTVEMRLAGKRYVLVSYEVG
jgi:hypothetical protein